MAPSRSQKRPRSHPHHLNRPFREDHLPGIQKLKSALRQTKRLLARDNLAADVRVETERRSKALEADLARAEQARKERQYATKYHKVKFFERQKVVRKINQTKRSIETSEDKMEVEDLESALADLRVDLNYILHFPKTQKYVSLFPPEFRKSGSTTTLDDNEERSRMRLVIRRQMECGELSTEPENELGKQGREPRQSVSSRREVDVPPLIKTGARTNDVASDGFFGDDDEEDSEQSEASDS